MLYNEAKNKLETSKKPENGKPLQNNTRLYQRGENYCIQLHQTDVVTITPDNTYILNSGGWQTKTTKDRINTYISNDYTGIRVWQKKGLWFIGDSIFFDGIKIKDNKVLNPKTPNDTINKKKKLDKMINKYIKGFCESIKNNGLKYPDTGDCWGCAFSADNKNEPLGYSHYIEHIKENYYVPSLLYKAIKIQGYNSPELIYNIIKNGDTEMAKRVLVSHFRKIKHHLINEL